MPIIANNIIVGGKNITEEPVVAPPVKLIVEQPKKEVPLRKRLKAKHKFAKEHEHGILLGDGHTHSHYLNDMLSIDKE